MKKAVVSAPEVDFSRPRQNNPFACWDQKEVCNSEEEVLTILLQVRLRTSFSRAELKRGY